MARPVSITREMILSAAVSVVRNDGVPALTSRNLCTALGCGVNAIFSAFGSMEGVLEAVKAEARSLFDRRLAQGLTLKPPFKGFGMALLWFAMDEPELFKLNMEQRSPSLSFEEYIDTHIGFKPECLAAIGQSFGLQGKEAEMIYYQLLLVGLGLAQTCTLGGAELSIPQISEILGKNVRAFLMVIRAGADSRESFMPTRVAGPEGDVDSYLLIQSLAGQNHLLQELHAHPRYIKDGEWVELERVLRNSFSLTPVSLKEAHPGLTPGDIRVFMLSHLQFTVSEQALLLGISPVSVTKARQRLKGKLKNQQL